MVHPSLEMLFFLVSIGFVAAFVDAVVGGGGLIAVPALLLTGLNPVLVLGTNKFAGTLSSLTSSVSFFFSGKINFRLVIWLVPLAFIGAAIGAYTVKQIPSEFLKPLVVFMLMAVTIYTLFKKNWGDKSTYQGLKLTSSILLAFAAFILGFYDGFFGPGTGSFLMFVFLLVGFDFVGASANAKVLNFASNLGGLIVFFLLKSVNLSYGIPLALAMIVGAIVGSRVAIQKGAAYVKPLFIIITVLLISKQLWSLIS
jgi:uncharacterized membrane protein YfcA